MPGRKRHIIEMLLLRTELVQPKPACISTKPTHSKPKGCTKADNMLLERYCYKVFKLYMLRRRVLFLPVSNDAK